MYAATGGAKHEMGVTYFKWGGRVPLASPLAMTMVLVVSYLQMHWLFLTCKCNKQKIVELY